jgi:cytochrome c peroxidase
MANLSILMDEVFVLRMGGKKLIGYEKQMLGPWLDRVPAPAPVVTADEATIERGRALFASPALACASCHNGDLLSNKQLLNVGTGGNFKVPSLLGVGARAPYMHDGCAATLMDRFTTCGGHDAHGQTSQLSPAELQDLVAYLDSI